MSRRPPRKPTAARLRRAELSPDAIRGTLGGSPTADLVAGSAPRRSASRGGGGGGGGSGRASSGGGRRVPTARCARAGRRMMPLRRGETGRLGKRATRLVAFMALSGNRGGVGGVLRGVIFGTRHCFSAPPSSSPNQRSSYTPCAICACSYTAVPTRDKKKGKSPLEKKANPSN
ncbi:hypothetical protein SETIT_9G423300v2 [Setaria italica]|uniref:Uncharacterized protein n=1 Tax=Setaria italica TaxID=4555 RepID=A0A368SRM6_SETIT|nr:hypothetical protein SETIT_9G423300v2 [Setaria italica]